MECGVPQGSELEPLLYIIYTADLTRIVDKHGLEAHSYADDLQIYSHVDTAQTSSLVLRLSSCVEDDNNWMAQNSFRLNPAKTERIWLGSPRRLQLCPKTPLLIAGALIQPSSHVRNLGVTLHSDLSMTTHIDKLAAVCFFHIRQLRLIRPSLDIDAAHVRALIHSRLENCNWVLAGLSLEKYYQSCPRVTFLGPDPTRPGETLTRPDPTRDCRQKVWPDPTRPAARPSTHMCILQLNNYLLII